MPFELPDDLISRLRARAADPETRTDESPVARGRTVTVGGFSVRGMDLGAMLRGDSDPSPQPRTSQSLPDPASTATLAHAEATLGFALPADLRQLYTDVADGGFGPGAGLMSLAELTQTWTGLRANPPGQRGQTWPDDLLPFTRTRPGHDCLNLKNGKIIVWDEESLAVGPSDKVWKRSFKTDSPDLASWLERWLSTKSPEQQMRDQMQEAMLNGMRASLEYWRAKTPQERAEFGLPEEGWENVLFGHLGIDLSKL